MKKYLDLLNHVLDTGYSTDDRTGTGTIQVPFYSYSHQLDAEYVNGELVVKNFPLLTTKFVSRKVMFHELMWKLKGDTNIKYLVENNIHIWTPNAFEYYLKHTGKSLKKWTDDTCGHLTNTWKLQQEAFENRVLFDAAFAKKYGDLGKVYGYQFRYHGGVDQLQEAINTIKKNPTSRRIIINLWNPEDMNAMALPPCPCFYEFTVERNKLHLTFLQRSCDVFLGVPYNLAEETLMLCMIACECGLVPSTINHVLVNAHVYNNLKDVARQQVTREPYKLPELHIPIKSISKYTLDDIKIVDYKHHEKLVGIMSGTMSRDSLLSLLFYGFKYSDYYIICMFVFYSLNQLGFWKKRYRLISISFVFIERNAR